MDLGAALFYAVATATIVASLGVVVTRSVVYSALLLILSLALTGLVYLLLLSDFLFMVQILVYGGTVSILLLFALMLTRPRESPVLNHRGWPLAALGAVLALGTLAFAVVTTDWSRYTPAAPMGQATNSAALGGPSRTTGSVTSGSSTTATGARASTGGTDGPRRIGPEEIGTALFTTWAVPFEVASVVLLVALVGSLLIARASETAEESAEIAPGTNAERTAVSGGAA